MDDKQDTHNERLCALAKGAAETMQRLWQETHADKKPVVRSEPAGY